MNALTTYTLPDLAAWLASLSRPITPPGLRPEDPDRSRDRAR